MSSYVLVHGAWHGAWCWYKIVPRLQALGHNVLAIDLPGNGIDRTPLAEVTHEGCAERVGQALDSLSEPAILVGHSMGGLVIGRAAELRPERVRKLVYLTAHVPLPGQTGRESREMFVGPATNPSAIPMENGLASVVNRAIGREIFYGDCSDDDVALALLALVPQAHTPMTTPIQLTAERYGRVPRVYIECLQDRAIPIAGQRAFYKASPCQVFTMDASHSPFFSKPDELTGILAGL